MKKLPEVKTSYNNIHDMVMAPIKSQLLKAGIDLGIFDALLEFSTVEQVAATIASHTDNTLRFLNALATIGLVQKQDGLFRNGPETAEFLVKSSPTYLGPFLKMAHGMCVEPLGNIGTLVKEGPLLKTDEPDLTSEDLWAQVTRTCAAWVSGGAGTQMAGLVSRLPEFSNFNRMLDLGGGHGMFTLYFISAHPTMTGVVYDRPAVVPVAEAFAAEYGLQERITVRAGDYLNDDIGKGYDFIWACSTLNFARDSLESMFSKISAALNTGGIFISFQDGLTHEQTQPDVMLGHLSHAMQMDADLFFEQGEISSTMLRCGFSSVQSRTIQTPMGAMDMDVARK